MMTQTFGCKLKAEVTLLALGYGGNERIWYILHLWKCQWRDPFPWSP